MLSGAAGTAALMPASLARALAIEPAPGSTFMDAEHVVILMQENRSFDHVYGTLSGVRGFEDPRAVTLPDGNPVWLQTDKDGRTFAPWSLDIHGSRSTWTGCLPHGRGDQMAAGNGGKHDRWLDAKRVGGELALAPLTLGHYDRKDIPFYYAFADAFTVFDQNFSSVRACTTPNRVFLWTGTNRDISREDSPVVVNNEQCDHQTRCSWPTFPERLEKAGVSWKTYSNENDLATGFSGREDSWLGCYGDNPLEYFEQYGAIFSPRRRAFVKKRIAELEDAVAEGEKTKDPRKKAALEKNRRALATFREEYERSSPENYAKLPAFARALHEKGLATNEKDPRFRKLSSLTYDDNGKKRVMQVPTGDVFHAFRKDVDSGKLPAVSWLVAPEAYSDHPSSAWFGAWYVSEALDILTKNPEVWKKTVFILTYDENDGYFDHVPPYSPPKNGDTSTGLASEGIDTARDFDSHGKQVGLGYRVPMVVASPWSRGGHVNSQITDHTSVIRFLELFLTQKTGKTIVEPNISSWRRAICGDLTSAFRPGAPAGANPAPVDHPVFVKSIDRAKYLGNPSGYRRLTPEDVAHVKSDARAAGITPRQEPGSRPSSALPYELYVGANVDAASGKLRLSFESGKRLFASASAGAPFRVYAPGDYKVGSGTERCRNWDYAVKAGDRITDDWSIASFVDGRYFLRVYGPNGFFREFSGAKDSPPVEIEAEYGLASGKPDGSLVLRLVNRSFEAKEFVLKDRSYGAPDAVHAVAAGTEKRVRLALSASACWYDTEVTVAGATGWSRRLAGRCETGRTGSTDPVIGRA